jgi:hypothetical protein
MKLKLIALLLLQSAVWGSLKAEMPLIRIAAERNGIKYKSDDWYLLLAIRLSENGGNGKQFGILNHNANTLDKQAGWASATIMAQHRRSGINKVNEAFIRSLAKRYCPIGVKNDPNGLNVNWKTNVSKFYRRLKNV